MESTLNYALHTHQEGVQSDWDQRPCSKKRKTRGDKQETEKNKRIKSTEKMLQASSIKATLNAACTLSKKNPPFIMMNRMIIPFDVDEESGKVQINSSDLGRMGLKRIYFKVIKIGEEYKLILTPSENEKFEKSFSEGIKRILFATVSIFENALIVSKRKSHPLRRYINSLGIGENCKINSGVFRIPDHKKMPYTIDEKVVIAFQKQLVVAKISAVNEEKQEVAIDLGRDFSLSFTSGISPVESRDGPIVYREGIWKDECINDGQFKKPLNKWWEVSFNIHTLQSQMRDTSIQQALKKAKMERKAKFK